MREGEGEDEGEGEGANKLWHILSQKMHYVYTASWGENTGFITFQIDDCGALYRLQLLHTSRTSLTKCSGLLSLPFSTLCRGCG